VMHVFELSSAKVGLLSVVFFLACPMLVLVLSCYAQDVSLPILLCALHHPVARPRVL